MKIHSDNKFTYLLTNYCSAGADYQASPHVVGLLVETHPSAYLLNLITESVWVSHVGVSSSSSGARKVTSPVSPRENSVFVAHFKPI